MSVKVDRATWFALVVVAGLSVMAAVAIAGLPDERNTFVIDPSAIPTTTLPAPATSVESATLGTSRSVAASERPTVVIIGDSYTAGSDMGGVAERSWPGVLERRLAADGVDAKVSVEAVGGTGYVTVGQSGQTFADLVTAEVTSGADVVVVFGSRNDSPAGPEAIGAAATAAFDQVRALAPDATLLVIGPPWVDENVPEAISAGRDALRAAAEAVGATFFDPLAAQWFFGPDATLIGTDGVHPTDEGHVYMAARIAPWIEQALEAAGGS